MVRQGYDTALLTADTTSKIRLYQAYYGLMVCPWYAYSQTMISEVSPLPQMYVHQGTLASSRVAR